MSGKPSVAARLEATRMLGVRRALSLEEAAAMLKVSGMTLRRWVKAGRVPCVRSGQGANGGKLWFRERDLAAFREAS